MTTILNYPSRLTGRDRCDTNNNDTDDDDDDGEYLIIEGSLQVDWQG